MPSELPENSILIAIPAFNAGAHVAQLVQRLRHVTDIESVLFVDDGSTDDTVDQLSALGVKVIRHPTNRGKGAALRSAFRYALANSYRSVLTMDSDLQHLPEEIERLAGLDNGYKIIVGCRKHDHMMPPARRLSNLLTSIVISILGRCRIRDSQSGFRLLPTAVLRRMDLRSDGFGLESELILRATQLRWPIREVAVTTVYAGSESYISHFTDTLRFIGLIMGRLFW